MSDELQIRINKLHDELMDIVHSFSSKYDEPFIKDNIYFTLFIAIEARDPGLAEEIYPEVKIDRIKNDFEIQIVYHRIQ